MSIINYTIYKGPGACGTQTHFTLVISPEPGYRFVNAAAQETQGLYVTKVHVTLEEEAAGPPVTFDLCDAPVVCFPDSVPLTITTQVDGKPEKTEQTTEDYNQAQVGGGKTGKASS